MITFRSRATRPLAIGALALALLAGTTACGSDGGTDGAADPLTTTTGPAVAGGAGKTVEVTAVDYAFEGLPTTVKAGTRLSLTNHADAELHELVAFRLDDAETRPVADLVKLPEAELGAILAKIAPETVLLAEAGKAQIPAVGDGTLTAPGRYLIMCAIPTGADPAAYLKAAAEAKGEKPEVAGGAPHFVAGMFGEVTVVK